MQSHALEELLELLSEGELLLEELLELLELLNEDELLLEEDELDPSPGPPLPSDEPEPPDPEDPEDPEDPPGGGISVGILLVSPVQG